MIQNEHLKLLMKREGKVVLGKYCINLWLLSLVLIATFISIAFSNGSLDYLREKMENPFTNWINIANEYEADEQALRNNLYQKDVQDYFGFTDVQADNVERLSICGKKDSALYGMDCRFFERMETSLTEAVLNKDNVINNFAIDKQHLSDNSFGFIITGEALQQLGYDLEHVPPYLEFMANSRGADTLGVTVYEEGWFAKAPVPVLAVVHKLPMNMEMVASKFFYDQYDDVNGLRPLNMNNEEYCRQLYFFVSSKIIDFERKATNCIPDSLRTSRMFYPIEDNSETMTHLRSWKSGQIIQIEVGTRFTPTSVYMEIAKAIQNLYSPLDVCRIYDYKAGSHHYDQFRFLSLSFEKLDSIRSFEKYVKDNFNFQIEMSEVKSKENFHAVSVMANILSWAIIIFAIVCILIFILNMLQSYFQKVKRNLGTFKAFGISSAELIWVYVLIMLGIILTAIAIALFMEQLVERMLPVLGMLKDGEFNLLSLWQGNTWMAIGIIIVATVVTVTWVMRNLLKQTPGDLIYDRN